MAGPERLADTSIPRLPRGVRVRFDAVRGTHMLLAPERAVRLDAIAAAILGETDGVRSVSEIAEVLAGRYGAPVGQVLGDVRGFLIGLMDKRMVEAG